MSPPRKRAVDNNDTETTFVTGLGGKSTDKVSGMGDIEEQSDDVLARALASHERESSKRPSEAPVVLTSSSMSDRKITPTKPTHPPPSSLLMSSSSSRDAWHSRSAARATANHVLSSVGKSGVGGAGGAGGAGAASTASTGGGGGGGGGSAHGSDRIPNTRMQSTVVEDFPRHDYGDDLNDHGSSNSRTVHRRRGRRRMRGSNGEDSDSDGSRSHDQDRGIGQDHHYHENHARHAKRTSTTLLRNTATNNDNGNRENDDLGALEEHASQGEGEEEDQATRWSTTERQDMSDIPSAADSYWPSRDYETDHATTEKPPSRGWSPAFVDFVNREHKIIYYNVGGTTFATSRDTIANDEFCMLNVMLKHESSMASSRDVSGALFIDRDPSYFSYVLNYLRNGIVDLPPERHKLNALLREAEFYQINGLYSAVQKHRRRRARVTREGLLTMINTRGSSELMLPNTDFSGEDLSHLSLTKGMFMNCDLCEADMRYSDFERTRFSGALFRGANLSNASFTEAKLDGADLSGANLQKTQLYKCDLKNANLRGCDLMRANLQQANLQGVSLQGANLQGVILHGANLRNFDLEGANLQGANLEGANLEGAILHKANLKGANLWEANLQNADLHQANLRDANLHRANMRGVVGEYLR